MNEWIPTERELPAVHKDVLITVAHEKYGEWDYVSLGYICGGKAGFWCYDGGKFLTTDNVTAWMELPAPYNADK